MTTELPSSSLFRKAWIWSGVGSTLPMLGSLRSRVPDPLISWVQAGAWSAIGGKFKLGDAEDLLPCPVRCSKDAFVLRVRGQSMAPKFQDGDLIFVDPQVAPSDGKYVVVRLEDSQEATFKQLIVEGGRQYLQALNPDWPNRIIEVDANATICGVVVFKGELV